MKYRFSIAMIGAGLCMATTVAPAAAQERDLVWGKVKLDDLNYNSAAGQRTARERVDREARRLCADGTEGRAGVSTQGDRRRCEAEVRASGDRRIAQLQAEQRRVEAQRLAAQRAQLQREMTTRQVAVRKVAAKRYRSCTWPKRYEYKKRVCVWRTARR